MEDDSEGPSSSELFKCLECNFRTCAEHELVSHIATQHETKVDVTEATATNEEYVIEEAFKCELCDFQSAERDCVVEHINATHVDDRQTVFKCPECAYEGAKEGNLVRHMKRRHPAEGATSGEYACDKCDFKATTRRGLQTHSKSHKEVGEVFQCTQCPYVGRHKSSLTRHITMKHGRSRFACDRCTFKTRDHAKMTSHVCGGAATAVAIAMPSPSVYRCEMCRFETTRLGLFEAHQLKQHPWYECNKCPFKTRTKANIAQHIFYDHTDKIHIEYKCERCDYLATGRDDLSQHLVSHHTNCNGIKWFKCTHCAFKAMERNLLEQHLNEVHDDEAVQEINCKVCGEEFLEWTELRHHNLTIHSDQWFQCHLCKLTTQERTKMEQHVMTEHVDATVKAWYSCYRCKFFAQSREIIEAHMRHKHKHDVDTKIVFYEDDAFDKEDCESESDAEGPVMADLRPATMQNEEENQEINVETEEIAEETQEIAEGPPEIAEEPPEIVAEAPEISEELHDNDEQLVVHNSDIYLHPQSVYTDNVGSILGEDNSLYMTPEVQEVCLAQEIPAVHENNGLHDYQHNLYLLQEAAEASTVNVDVDSMTINIDEPDAYIPYNEEHTRGEEKIHVEKVCVEEKPSEVHIEVVNEEKQVTSTQDENDVTSTNFLDFDNVDKTTPSIGKYMDYETEEEEQSDVVVEACLEKPNEVAVKSDSDDVTRETPKIIIHETITDFVTPVNSVAAMETTNEMTVVTTTAAPSVVANGVPRTDDLSDLDLDEYLAKKVYLADAEEVPGASKLVPIIVRKRSPRKSHEENNNGGAKSEDKAASPPSKKPKLDSSTTESVISDVADSPPTLSNEILKAVQLRKKIERKSEIIAQIENGLQPIVLLTKNDQVAEQHTENSEDDEDMEDQEPTELENAANEAQFKTFGDFYAFVKKRFNFGTISLYQKKFASKDGAKALMFANDVRIEHLNNVKVLYVDASFRIETKDKFQTRLLTVLVWAGDRYFPVMYALFNKKSLDIFKMIFAHLRDILAPHIKPEEIIMTYEAALYYSLGETYPNALIGGSVFYYAQKLQQKLFAIDPKKKCRQNANVKTIFEMLVMLPFLPQESILSGLEYVESKAVQLKVADRTKPLFDYFRSEWVNKVTLDLFCVYRSENRVVSNVEWPFKKLRSILNESDKKHGAPMIMGVIESLFKLEMCMHQSTMDESLGPKREVVKGWLYLEKYSKTNINTFFSKVSQYIGCLVKQLKVWRADEPEDDDELISAANITA